MICFLSVLSVLSVLFVLSFHFKLLSLSFSLSPSLILSCVPLVAVLFELVFRSSAAAEKLVLDDLFKLIDGPPLEMG